MAAEHESSGARYRERCLRAIGIMNPEQLEEIRNTPIAVAGLGLGGSIFLNLVRLGFENFNVADPDVYERTNVNRQRQAKETTLDCRKDDCLIQEARAINPDIRIRAFREGVNQGNAAEFLEGAKWVVDAVDIFAMPEKVALHEVARSRKLPVVTCVSVGFGAAIVTFDNQGGPSFTELSGLDLSAPYEVNIDRFVNFIVPEIPSYMSAQVAKAMTRSSHLPFVVNGVEFSAALTCTEICKNMLGIGDRVMAPHGIYFNPVTLKLEQFQADHRLRKHYQGGDSQAAWPKAA